MQAKKLVSPADLSAADIDELFTASAVLKERFHSGIREQALQGKTLVAIFEKASLRTRLSFEIAMNQLGGQALSVTGGEIRLGDRETVPDAARVIGRYADVIAVRTFAQRTVVQMARYARAPVINALSDEHHPCQALADLLTIRERFGAQARVRVCFVGDGNNVARSLAWFCAKLGIRFVLAAPKGYGFDGKFLSQVRKDAGTERLPIREMRDPAKAVKDADVIYTDVWASMGQEEQAAARRTVFRDYQVNQELLKHAPDRAVVMHCLPAHRGDEITDKVVDGPQSIVFDQAENRLHLQKGLLFLLLGGQL